MRLRAVVTRRAYRPGLDGDPERIAAGRKPLHRSSTHPPWPRRYPQVGSKTEPGHGQRVHVGIRPSGKVELATYNRDERSFWIWLSGDWLEIGSGPVAWWSQLPPKPRPGRTAAEMYG